MTFFHKHPYMIACFMIFWQAVDIAPAPSLLEIVALAYIKYFMTSNTYLFTELFNYLNNFDLKTYHGFSLLMLALIFLLSAVTTHHDTFYFLLKKMWRSGFKWLSMLNFYRFRVFIYNDVQTTQNRDKGQQHQLKTTGSQCQWYQHWKIQRSVPTTQVKIRPFWENQCFYTQNFDQ